jgi:hypothetical protein
MSTATIVVVTIWNALLLIALVAAITWRTEALRWITGLDVHDRTGWDRSEDEWSAFLAEHPELVDR